MGGDALAGVCVTVRLAAKCPLVEGGWLAWSCHEALLEGSERVSGQREVHGST